MSPYFRKKPLVIEARQFVGTGESLRSIIEWAPPGMITGPFDEDSLPYLEVRTIEGVMRVTLGDWVIKGVAHEYYPCKSDIFGYTYEQVEPE